MCAVARLFVCEGVCLYKRDIENPEISRKKRESKKEIRDTEKKRDIESSKV